MPRCSDGSWKDRLGIANSDDLVKNHITINLSYLLAFPDDPYRSHGPGEIFLQKLVTFFFKV